MKILGIAGWSGSGKTTLLKSLVPALVARGVRLSTIKHAHHNFDIDKKGKDSYEHRHAGAMEVMVASSYRWALLHELRDEQEPGLEDLVARMTPVDLLLVEGFKFDDFPKLEIHRSSLGKSLIAATDTNVIAVATDAPLAECPVETLNLNDNHTILDFVLKFMKELD